jgi:hypothetical protein
MIRIALNIAWSTHESGIRIRKAKPAKSGIRINNFGESFRD